MKTSAVTMSNESLSVCRLQVGNGPGSILHGQQSEENYRLKSLEIKMETPSQNFWLNCFAASHPHPEQANSKEANLSLKTQSAVPEA